MTCPVVEAIREIRGAGIYKDDPESSAEGVIRLGGSEGGEFVCDDMTFYMTSRKMDLARFALSKPDYAQCKAKYQRMFKGVVGADYSQLYTRIIDSALKKRFLYRQFVELVELIGEMESMIEVKVAQSARRGVPINISIPDMIMMPHVDVIILYRADVLESTMNKIVDYVNKVNVNAILAEPVHSSVPRVGKFAGVPPDMRTVVGEVDAGTAEEFLDGMRRVLDQEMVVAAYIREIEAYHCEVINHVNQVYDVCKKIISGLGA